MGIQIGARPDSGFDDPIGMLMDCHRRIEHFLNLLCVVVDRARGRALSAEETEAVQAALQYFRVGGKRHNADEEESLFPRLRGENNGGQFNEIHGLEEDHRSADALHASVEALYNRWISAGSLQSDEDRRLSANTLQLKSLYAGHIQIEEQIVFPRAADALDSAAIEAMGREFRERRQ
ncbi:MAG TPA: hemerythrin domain-containing protein [Terracidiphilus sp.]|nr:hemerythrin domain-containing protein [Terracidiphilus sp.]